MAKPVKRVLVTLPLATLEAVERFKEKRGKRSMGAAMATLIEDGLEYDQSGGRDAIAYAWLYGSSM